MTNSLAEEALERLKQLDRLLGTASSALRSYEYGNSSPELAKEVADLIDWYLSGGKK